MFVSNVIKDQTTLNEYFMNDTGMMFLLNIEKTWQNVTKMSLFI